MPEQKSSASLFISAGLIVVVILGGMAGYYFLHLRPTPAVTTDDSNTPSKLPDNSQTVVIPSSQTATSAPMATIDMQSLGTNSHTPTITGTFGYTTGIEVVVSDEELPQTSLLSDPIPGVEWDDRSDHGGGVSLDGSSAGRFSDTVATPLIDGTYHVGIYVVTIYYPQTDENYARDYRTLLTSSTFTIRK